MVVFHDELDLAAGKVRVKRGGGAAGHNGLRSIDAHLGPDYWRVRLGIGHPGRQATGCSATCWTTSPQADRDWLEPLLEAVADARAAAGGGRCRRLHEQGGAGARAAAAESGGEAGAPGQEHQRRIAGPGGRLSGFQLRHRRPAERRQVDPLQRADRERGGGRRPTSRSAPSSPTSAGCRCRTSGWRRIAGIAKSAKIVPTQLEFVDIAGLVAGASHGEGLGNQFLGHIREVDAIIHVLRCFDDPDVVHVDGAIDPLRDVEIIETELMLADLDSLERRGERRWPSAARAATRRRRRRWRWPSGRLAALRDGRPARAVGARPRTSAGVRRPAAADRQAGALRLQRRGGRRPPRATRSPRGWRRGPRPRGRTAVVISAQIEAEVAELPAGGRAEYLAEPGPGRDRPRPGDPRRLRAARPHHLLHRRAEGDARLDDRAAAPRRRRRRASSTPISSAASSAPRPSPTTTSSRWAASRRRARPGGCARKAATTSSPTATSCCSASTSDARRRQRQVVAAVATQTSASASQCLRSGDSCLSRSRLTGSPRTNPSSRGSCLRSAPASFCVSLP